MERAVKEVAIDRTCQWPAVRCDGRHHKQPHPLQSHAELLRTQPPLVGDDAAQMRSGTFGAAVEQLLQSTHLRCCLVHDAIQHVPYDA